MKKLIYLVPAVIIMAGFSACTSYDYYTAAINKTNLSSYHTFAWMPPSKTNDKKMGNNEADARIKDAATSALVSKGLRLSQRNPDLVVSYSAVVGRGVRTNYYYPYYSGGYGWGGYGGFGYGGFGWGGYGGFGWGGGFGWSYRPYYYAYGAPFAYGGYPEKEHYKEGTLIIDLIDTHTRKIVWRGFGVGEVHKNPQKSVEDLPKVVNGVLTQLQLSPANYRSDRS